jgi:uncharacterized protein (DUF1778 family)
MSQKTESILVRMSANEKMVLLKAADSDHRPLANFMVHASMLYAKELLGDKSVKTVSGKRVSRK